MFRPLVIGISAAVIVLLVFVRCLLGQYDIVILHFMVVPLLLALVWGYKRAVYGLFILSLVMVMVFAFFGIHLLGIAITGISFIMIPFAFISLGEHFEHKRKKLLGVVKEAQDDCSRMQDEVDSINNFIHQTEQRFEEISSLYEVAKKMSAVLLLDDIIRIFGGFIRERFAFRRLRLVLIGYKKSFLYIDRVFQLQGRDFTDQRLFATVDTNEQDSKVLNHFLQRAAQPLYLVRPDQSAGMETFGVPAYAGAFIAIPLTVKDKLVGILYGEDFVLDDFNKIVVLAGEFALELKKVLLYEEVQRMAIVDGLTGIYTRRHLLERFDEELVRARDKNIPISFLMIDLDNFKKCNDYYGHLVGDIVLRQIATILRDNIRVVDLIGRYGGEEFSVILDETDGQGALILAERIRQMIETHVFTAYDESLSMTVSIGIASYPKDGTTQDELIEKADSAMYQAKKLGKNCVSLAS